MRISRRYIIFFCGKGILVVCIFCVYVLLVRIYLRILFRVMGKFVFNWVVICLVEI